MPKGEGQKIKLFKLLEILISMTDEEHGLSLKEIIDLLKQEGIGAERKSIYDDFLSLEELGFYVERTATRPPKYFLSNKIFEIAELKMLVDAIQSSRFITAKKSREIIDKLELFVSKYQHRQLSRQVYIEDRIKSENNSAIYSIDNIHTAINEKKKLSFKYFDYNGDKEKVFRHGGTAYIVSPCSLIWDDEKYYLVALDESADTVKNFRVDKMDGVNVLNENIKDDSRVREFNPADYSNKIFGMYGGNEELVTLECREKLAGVIIDRFGFNPHFTKTDFGFKLTLKVFVSPTFYAWILGLGEDIRILSPVSVREDLLKFIKKIAGNYEN